MVQNLIFYILHHINNMSSDKQLHIASRTFDIVPTSVVQRNLQLERGAFNQVSGLELKNPNRKKELQQFSKTTSQYFNPYVITQTDFNSDYNTRKLEKRNRTNIIEERLSMKSQYINNTNNNTYSERFHQIDQKNLNSDKFKSKKVNDKTTFQEYLDFKKSLSKEGGAKY